MEVLKNGPKTMELARWILLPFVSIAAWCVALIIGLVILSIAESFCPEDQQVSGMCVAPWWEPVETCILCFSAGLSAFLVVTTAFVVAPAARKGIAWSAFGLGGTIALIFGMETSAWGMLASAIATGFLTACVLTRPRFSLSVDRDRRPTADGAS